MRSNRLLLIAAILAWACGSSPTKDKTVAPDAQLGDVQAEAKLCPKGGTFHFGPVTVEAPEDAVEACATLVVEEWSEVPKGHLGPAFHLFLDEGVLLRPVLLTIRLDAEEVPAPYDYAALELAWIVDAKWQLLAESTADTAAYAVSTHVDSLGIFGIVPRVKLDVLWVTQNASSMSQERVVSAVEMARFTADLAAEVPNLDLHFAAVTRAAAVGDGAFVQPGIDAPSSLGVQPRLWPCESAADCESAFGPGWICLGEEAPDAGNGSTYTRCEPASCQADADCCARLCYGGNGCSGSPPCPSPLCDLVEGSDCQALCSDEDKCITAPYEVECAGLATPVVHFAPADGADETALLPCLLQPVEAASYFSVLDSLFTAAWRSLDPAGPNAAAAADFLRPDAVLLVLFFAQEEECSVAPGFASPGYTCATDEDCLGGAGRCLKDDTFSELSGKPVKLCHGIIKKDYYNACGLLGDFQGLEHHECLYDLECQDCESDADCPPLWECKSGKKCRPLGDKLQTAASYQSPPGSPLFSLWSPEEFLATLRTLKTDPDLVLVGSLAGDGLVFPDDQDSFISQACLEHPALKQCAAYTAAAAGAGEGCLTDPGKAGCEALYTARLACIRECYQAAAMRLVLGEDPDSDFVFPFVCEGPYGTAWLGERYARLVEAAGSSGVHVNLCHPQGIPFALDRVRELVVSRVQGE